MISKILLQKSKEKVEDHIVEMIASNLTEEWNYINYVNGEEVKFFKDNPLDEFPDIVNKFNSYENNQHKTDLFRYYYLYINGGVYLNSYAMLHENITKIVKDYDLVAVISFFPSSIFNGFIATIPKHPLIYAALKYMYEADTKSLLLDYHKPGKFLYDLLSKNKYDNIFLYKEYLNKGVGYTYDKDSMSLIVQYYIDKTVPRLKEKEKLTSGKVRWESSTLKKVVYYKK